MAVNTRHMDGVSTTAVFDALRDGYTYEHWVVGTRKVRAVSPAWPQPGSDIHYTVGYAPLRKDDKTTSVRYEPDSRLELEAQVWPAGTLAIVLQVEAVGSGATVTITETTKEGLLKKLDNPLVDLAIKARNVETLRRLEKQARLKQGAPTAPA